MKQPRLTIAIPTYNRPERIKNQIRSLLAQITEDVIIVILDNHSETAVSSVFDKGIPAQVKIIRNQFNIGADGNIAKCFDVCETDWLWTLSDDDVISDDAIPIILRDIETHDDCIFLNYNKRIEREIIGIKDLSEQIKEEYSDLFWMSICLYNVRLLGRYMCYYYNAISTMQPGVALLIKAMSDNSHNKIFLSSDIIVQSGGKVISWNRESFLFSTLFLLDYLRSYSKGLNRSLFKTISKMCCSNILEIFNNNRSCSKAVRLHYLVIKRRGLMNSLLYDTPHNLAFIAHLLYYKLFNRHIRVS